MHYIKKNLRFYFRNYYYLIKIKYISIILYISHIIFVHFLICIIKVIVNINCDLPIYAT